MRETTERQPDGGLADWIECLEDAESGGQGCVEDSQLLLLLIELRRLRENNRAITAQPQNDDR